MQESFKVPEVSCGHCKQAIEGALGPLEGVSGAEVDIAGKVVQVDFDPAVTDRASVVAAIESAGYDVVA